MSSLKNNWADNFILGTDLNDIANAVNGLNQAGPFASLPAPSFPGRLYVCTDVDLILRDNGTSWDRIAIGSISPAAPPSSAWTTTTMGAATIATNKDARLLTIPSAAGDNWRAEYRALASPSTFTATFYIEWAFAPGNYLTAGILLRNSTSGSFISFGLGYDTSASGFYLGTIKWTSPTVLSAVGTRVSTSTLVNGMPSWLRIRDDGTNRFYQYSTNALDWITFGSTVRTDFITADQIGWGGNNSSGVTGFVRVRSFVET